jgi:uncharacterized protein
VPVFIKYLDNFSALLEKGAKYAEENQKSEDDILKYRLVADMQGYVRDCTSSTSDRSRNAARSTNDRMGLANAVSI